MCGIVCGKRVAQQNEGEKSKTFIKSPISSESCLKSVRRHLRRLLEASKSRKQHRNMSFDLGILLLTVHEQQLRFLTQTQNPSAITTVLEQSGSRRANTSQTAGTWFFAKRKVEH